MHFTTGADRDMIAANVDEFGDSYCRDLTVDNIRKLCDSMKTPSKVMDQDVFFNQLEDHGIDIDELQGNLFRRVVTFFDDDESDVHVGFARQIVRFANGKVINNLDDPTITHIVVGKDRSRLDHIRTLISK
jgi:DNA ligase 4